MHNPVHLIAELTHYSVRSNQWRLPRAVCTGGNESGSKHFTKLPRGLKSGNAHRNSVMVAAQVTRNRSLRRQYQRNRAWPMRKYRKAFVLANRAVIYIVE